MSYPAELTTGARILIVDDEPVGARAVAAMLEGYGHQVELAHDWTAAIRMFRPEIDLVLMDVILPDVDGFKLTRLLRQKSSVYVPVVLVTGRDDPDAKERGLVAGADDFLSKPVDPFELRTRVAAMLRIRRLTMALHQQAHIDSLTGIGNRYAFDQEWDRRKSEFSRYKRTMSLLMFDVDHFKKVNDTYGHEEGDEVLRVLGRVMRQTIRKCDRAYRFGGEEFVVFAPETNVEGAVVLANRIREAFFAATGATLAGRQTVSVGVVGVSEDADDVDAHSLLHRADELLYEAKHKGRDQVRSASLDDR